MAWISFSFGDVKIYRKKIVSLTHTEYTSSWHCENDTL